MSKTSENYRVAAMVVANCLGLHPELARVAGECVWTQHASEEPSAERWFHLLHRELENADLPQDPVVERGAVRQLFLAAP